MARKSQGADITTDVSGENKVVSAKTNLTGGTTMEKTEISYNDLLEIVRGLEERIRGLQKDNSLAVASVQDFQEDDMDEFDSTQIRQDEYIKVISLTPFVLNLTTKAGGKGGKIFTFNSFGSTKRILYSDLVEILENFSHFLEAGYFYIMDKRVIRRHGLDEAYSKILSKDKIETILDGKNNDTTISLFKSSNKKQQDIIIQMLIDSMIQGKEVDLNLIDKLSRTSGVKIQEKYEDTKKYVESLNIPKEEEKKE